MIKSILVVSDTHCGSRQGLLKDPDKHKLADGSASWLWSSWKKMIRGLPKIDLLVLNGDLIDGSQKRGDGCGLITTNLSEQTDLAIEAFEPLMNHCSSSRVVRLIGTAHHEGLHGTLRQFDSHYGVEQPKDLESAIALTTEAFKGTVVNIKHSPEGGGNSKAGIMDRERLASIHAERCGVEPINIILRSHLHCCYDFCDIEGRKRVILNGCWANPFAYAKEKKYFSWRGTVGSTLLVYNPDSFLNCDVRFLNYRAE